MAHNNSELAAGDVLALKAVSLIAALLAVFVYSTALFFAHWDARGMSISIGTLVLGVAAGLWTYAVRPGWFSGKDRVVGDPWRTHYRTPAQAAELVALSAPAAPVAELGRAARPSNAKRFFGVTEHIYAWQDVRRVLPGERVWTRSYVRRVLGEAGAVVAALVVTVVAGAEVAVLLGTGGGDLSFIAAVAVLSLTFALSVRAVGDSERHPTETMAPTFDADWHPTLVTTVADGPHSVHAA